MKTPLRYPGGKSRAIKHILPLIPEDITELCSPFLGGGSVELAVAERGTTVYNYDLFQPVVWFWQALLKDPVRLAETAESYRVGAKEYTSIVEAGAEWATALKKCANAKTPCRAVTKRAKDKYCSNHQKLIDIDKGRILGISKEDFHDIKKRVNNRTHVATEDELFIAAAEYYLVNRTSFSGSTTSGGWSWKASWARLTPSTLENLRKFKVENFHVEQGDFKDSISKHPDTFLYCDPPYMLGKEYIPAHDDKDGNHVAGYWLNRETLYGTDGDLHEGFDHQGLHEILTQRSGWVLSYNDCEEIRDLYSSYEIREAEWAYGMKNIGGKKMGKSSEILIIG